MRTESWLSRLCGIDFGVVALEGIACGCVIVGSEGGGLEEAIGPCGVTFPNSNCNYCRAVKRSADFAAIAGAVQSQGQGPSDHHTKSAVGEKYLQVFTSALPVTPQEQYQRNRH